MEKLQQLPNVAQLTKRVCRILGQNPGKFTLQGTNTYLIGERAPFILVDTGEGRPSYLPFLEDALRTSFRSNPNAQQRSPSFSDVIITHHHHDHFGGLQDVLSLSKKLWDEKFTSSSVSESAYSPPRIHKFKAADYKSETSGASSRDENEEALNIILSSLPRGTFTAPKNSADSVLHTLRSIQILKTQDGSSTLSIIHTPGHTPDSIALYLHEEHILFTADSVLGHGTAVFEDLAAYLASLRKLLEMRDKDEWAFHNVYPAHGPVVEDGPALIKKYIDHRLEREGQILDLLEKTSAVPERDEAGSWSIEELVSVIYKEYPESLWLPAAHGVELHLRKLQSEQRVIFLNGDGMKSRWLLRSKL